MNYESPVTAAMAAQDKNIANAGCKDVANGVHSIDILKSSLATAAYFD